MPRLTLLAGPNGAGKTTFARGIFAREIAQGLFLNADDIARDLKAESVDEAALAAGRAALRRRRERLAQGQDLVLETRPCPAAPSCGT